MKERVGIGPQSETAMGKYAIDTTQGPLELFRNQSSAPGSVPNSFLQGQARISVSRSAESPISTLKFIAATCTTWKPTQGLVDSADWQPVDQVSLFALDTDD